MRGRNLTLATAVLACHPQLPAATTADEPTTTIDGATSVDGTTTGDSTSAATTTSTSSSTGEPGTTTGAASPCSVADIAGECLDITACPADATAFQALCDGPPALQCCVPAAPPCSVDGAPGLCISVDACAAPDVPTPGHCPGDATIQCCTDPATACDPDAAPDPNAGLSEAPGTDNCPPGMLRIAGTFCIDRHEAALAGWSPYHNPGDARLRAVSLSNAVPQGYITQVQAAAACAEAGKRLCSDAEWLRACRGASTTLYPYGDELIPGACNDARATHPAVEYFGTAADWIWSELGNACISQIPASLALTGQHPACISEDGALDMMGNLHEWTADPAGTFRGGFYVDTILNGPGCTYATTAHDIHHWDYSTGFRCCAD